MRWLAPTLAFGFVAVIHLPPRLEPLRIPPGGIPEPPTWTPGPGLFEPESPDYRRAPEDEEMA